MKSIVTIKDKHLEIEMDGFRMLYPLENIVVFTDDGTVRGDVMYDLYQHASNQNFYGSCPPMKCEICKAKKEDNKTLADKMRVQ